MACLSSAFWSGAGGDDCMACLPSAFWNGAKGDKGMACLSSAFWSGAKGDNGMACLSSGVGSCCNRAATASAGTLAAAAWSCASFNNSSALISAALLSLARAVCAAFRASKSVSPICCASKNAKKPAGCASVARLSAAMFAGSAPAALLAGWGVWLLIGRLVMVVLLMFGEGVVRSSKQKEVFAAIYCPLPLHRLLSLVFGIAHPVCGHSAGMLVQRFLLGSLGNFSQLFDMTLPQCVE